MFLSSDPVVAGPRVVSGCDLVIYFMALQCTIVTPLHYCFPLIVAFRPSCTIHVETALELCQAVNCERSSLRERKAISRIFLFALLHARFMHKITRILMILIKFYFEYPRLKFSI